MRAKCISDSGSGIIPRGILAAAILLALGCRGFGQSQANGAGAEIVFATDHLRYLLGSDGANLGYVDTATGSNHIASGSRSYFATLNKRGSQFPGSITSCTENDLVLKFGDSGTTARVRVEKKPDYLTFEVRELSDPAGITELSLLNLQLDINGESTDAFAACAVDLNLQTFNANIPGYSRTLHVYCQSKDGFIGAKVAVIGCPGAALQNTLKQVIRDHRELPQTNLGGPWAAEAPVTRGSYLIEMGRLNETNVDEWIAVAKSIGARQIDLHCGKTLRFGDLEPNRQAYPSGFDGVRKVVGQLHAAGLQAGLHTYAFYLAKDSKWVSPVPDPRLGKDKTFTLAKAVDDRETTLLVEEPTHGMSTITGFQIPNSVTLQIDDELMVFSEIATNLPYGFTKCQRGACGTRPATHSRHARVSQLKELFGLFSPDGDSTLFDELARRTAQVYNDGGFDMIYLDAIDGAGALAGKHSPAYYQGKFIFELNKHLKRPALMEMSAFDSHFWFARSRAGAWDVPSKSYKRFINHHYTDNQLYAKSFLPGNIGWWAIWDWTPKERIRMFPEDVEYILCKSLASGDSLSWIECFTPESFAKSPSQKRFAALIKQYEELRLAGYFPESTRRKLGRLDQDFRLEQSEAGQWQFRPIVCDKHSVSGMDRQSYAWTSQNPYRDQPMELRIEAGLSLASFDDAKGETVEDFQNLRDYQDKRSSPGVSFALETVTAPATNSPVSARLKATSTQADRLGAWSMTTRQFASTLDFSQRGFGVWVHGDGQGEVLNFMWKAPNNLCMGLDEHYVVVDFRGWKYFEFIEPESDRVGTYHWPYHCFSGAPYVETAWVAYDKINSLTLGCINLPIGKEVECFVGPVKALPHVTARLINPSITLGGKRVVFPIELESGYYIDFRSMNDCKVYAPDGKVAWTIKPQGDVPMLKAGENRLEFDCRISPAVNTRANITVISHDEQTIGK